MVTLIRKILMESKEISATMITIYPQFKSAQDRRFTKIKIFRFTNLAHNFLTKLAKKY